jgi:hypothetical protein
MQRKEEGSDLLACRQGRGLEIFDSSFLAVVLLSLFKLSYLWRKKYSVFVAMD